MYHYLFTNDLRISLLDESLKQAGHCFATDTVPSSSENKSANNNMMTLGFYFNLTKESNCAKLAAKGDTRTVVLNFIKKFQFPNLRTKESFDLCKADGITLAPMRTIVKLLYSMTILFPTAVAYLTKDEVKYFIFLNDKVAKSTHTDYHGTILDIINYRKTAEFPDYVETDETQCEWKHMDRQLREMLEVLEWSGCIKNIEDKYVIDNDDLSIDNKAAVYDIITYDEFWEGDSVASYRNYMDLDLPIDFDETIPTEENDNEYQRAANYLENYIKETGYEIPVDRETIEETRAEFINRYNLDVIESIPSDEFLQRIFFTEGDNTESLCYWIEMNKDCTTHFGSINGGSSYKFGLFQKKETGKWLTGGSKNATELNYADAVIRGHEIIEALNRGAKIIEESNPQTLQDYQKLDEELKTSIGEFYNLSWFHKYYSILFPTKLSSYHKTELQCHVLRCFGIVPAEGFYARSGQISLIQNYAGMLYGEFTKVMDEMFGPEITFVRLGTSDGETNYASDWKEKNVVALGWKDIGSLSNYVTGEGLDKSSIAEKLKELYYPDDDRLSSRKAGEIKKFYTMNKNTVIVAMSGQKLIALVDEIGSYYYDVNSHMAHIKSGKWHCKFSDYEELPNKSEGKLTSCYTIKDEENIQYLYQKYYYSQDLDNIPDVSEIEDPEERNKELFRQWLSVQIIPDGDSNAGEAYKPATINQYVSAVKNTPMLSVAERSLFYTRDVSEVQNTITDLDGKEKKNNTQKSAVNTYLKYLISTKEEYMPLIYNTNLECDYERNRIVFGAPGTGKSFKLKKDCDSIMSSTAGTFERVTFHPDYTYSQFVGTYKPVMNDAGSIRYDFVPGPFMRVYVDALKSGRTGSPQPHILLIEEINRAKVAAVFGDVFQLLDRDAEGVSEYEIQASEDIKRYLSKELGGSPDNYTKIRIPNNMFIWATMNSADQGVYPMDTAFKRRWTFEYLGINEKESDIIGIGKIRLQGTDDLVEWNALRKAINDKMSSSEFKINEDKLLGPFFLTKQVIESNDKGEIANPQKFMDAFKSKVIMYLYEDAVKQGKHKFFDGCDSSKYSTVCDAFDAIGMGIFGSTFEELYYDKYKAAK